MKNACQRRTSGLRLVFVWGLVFGLGLVAWLGLAGGELAWAQAGERATAGAAERAGGDSGASGDPSAGAADPSAGDPGAAMVLAAEAMVQRAIERAAPSVVAIGRVRRGERRDVAAAGNFNLPGVVLGRGGPWEEGELPTEFAAGVVLSSEGHILTCYHVVDDPQQNDYYVWLPAKATSDSSVGDSAVGESDRGGDPAGIGWGTGDGWRAGERRQARLLAGDPWTDLAVLKIDAEGLPAMPMGDAETLRRGSFVVALGNPYAVARDGRASASFGLVSNLQRRAVPRQDSLGAGGPALPESLQEFGTLIQTDAKLQLGFSGGALVNVRGEMVGLTTSLAAVAGFEQAAGYAIPMDGPTLATVEQLREGRAPAFGFLGVEPIDAPGGGGAMVRSVVPGMAADNAGLRPGDVITRVGERTVAGASDLFREMSRRPADSEVTMKVRGMNQTRERFVTARLGKKRLALARPGFSEVPEPSWRGMTVDFASALPPGRLLTGQLGKQGDAAVVRVDPDSPAWNAGVRPGRLVISAGGEGIRRPEDFYAAVEAISGEVELVLSGQFGRVQRVRVAEE